MAPNKKKNKKPAANPARGFATTSIASKSKADKVANGVPQERADVAATQANKDDSFSVSGADTRAEQPASEITDLTTLTPEQLEARLENEDLQLFVEKYGAKVKKDSSRTISRLLTERRLARTQAESLALAAWISGELMRDLVSRIRETGTATPSSCGRQPISGDELVARLWALKQTLEGLGFPRERCWEALTHLVNSPSLVEQAMNEESRDGLWGLGACLDWLGLSCNDTELPGYHAQPVTKRRELVLGLDVDVPFPSGMSLWSLIWY